MTQINNNINRSQMIDCGIPEGIIFFLLGDPHKTNHKGENILDSVMDFPVWMGKIKRFYDNWEKNKGTKIADQIQKDWKSIEEKSISNTALIAFFLNLPDAAEANPLQHIFGYRTKSVAEENAYYRELSKQCEEILNFINYSEQFKFLSTDVGATGGEANAKYFQFYDVKPQTISGLMSLRDCLNSVDAGAKIPAKKKNATDLPGLNYTHQLAQLNRFLTEPQPAPISRLAAINNPEMIVESETISRSWKRNCDKHTTK